jgi:hypothetical protein
VIESTVALMLVSLLVIGPLAWRGWKDSREAQALAVRAVVHAAVVHALGGESLVAVRVLAPTPWREGRVILSAPTGCEVLIWTVWLAVVARLPRTYDLVVQSGPRHVPRPRLAILAWGQAA